MEQHFVAAKYDVDKTTGKELLKRYGSGAIPLYLVFDTQGELLGRIQSASLRRSSMDSVQKNHRRLEAQVTAAVPEHDVEPGIRHRTGTQAIRRGSAFLAIKNYPVELIVTCGTALPHNAGNASALRVRPPDISPRTSSRALASGANSVSIQQVSGRTKAATGIYPARGSGPPVGYRIFYLRIGPSYPESMDFPSTFVGKPHAFGDREIAARLFRNSRHSFRPRSKPMFCKSPPSEQIRSSSPARKGRASHRRHAITRSARCSSGVALKRSIESLKKSRPRNTTPAHAGPASSSDRPSRSRGRTIRIRRS